MRKSIGAAGLIAAASAFLAPVPGFAQDTLDVTPAGGDAITMLALAAFTVVLAFLYARQIKRTAEVERALAVEREGARTAAESLPARLVEHERDILSAISIPVWRRDATGALRFGNASAQPLLPELEKASALAERAVKVGRAQSESRNLV
ncbi:MAG TPA: hypothetical protein VIR38_06230, partial [Thalassobaculum sp.]